MRLTTAVLIGLAVLAAASSQADTINFDSVAASTAFWNNDAGGAAGPTLTYPDLTLTGGVILDGSNFANEETTTPNLYATGDLYNLADGSSLPAFITGTFSAPGVFDSIDLDIANGFGASTFTLGAYDASNNLLSSQTLSLTGYATVGAVGHASVSGSGISYFTVTSNQGRGNIDFGIDTITLGRVSAVPEPGSVGLIASLGVSSVGFLVRRRKQAKKNA